MRRLAVTALVCALAALVLAGTGQTGFGGEEQGTYRVKVQFDNATGIVRGVDVKVAGARVGRVAGMDITDDQLAVLTLDMEEGFGPLRRDAECSVRLQSLIGEKFVECSIGTPDAKAIPAGGTLPVSKTHSPVDLDLVNNVLRKPYDERFRIILNEFGAGLAGRGEDLNVVIRRAAPALEQTNRVLRILARQNQVLRRLVEDSDVDIGKLAAKRRNVSGFIKRSGEVAEASATRRRELAETFRDLPDMLRELRPTMRQLGEFAGEMTPVQRDLGVAADDLRRTIKGLGEFSESSEPAFETLGEASKTGRSAVRKGAPIVKDLKPFAEKSIPVGVDLAEFLEASDSREYSVEENPAAPTNQGYTALEGILNYIFYQQTAINGFDELGYFLRVTLVQSGCSAYTDTPKTGAGSECRAHLGDPFVTESGEFQGSRRDGSDRIAPAPRTGDAPDAAPPAQRPAAPSPGETPRREGLEVPEVKLPPSVEKLLDSIGAGGESPKLPDAVPEALRGEGGTPLRLRSRRAELTRILDYLLAP